MDVIDDTTWFSGHDLASLRDRGARRTFRAGSTLFVEGDEPYDVAIIESGDVKLVTVAPNGNEVVLDVLGTGELMGELSALDGAPRSATAIALTDGTLTSIPVANFLTYLQEHPLSMGALLAVVVRRLRQANKRQLEFSTADALGRVCSRIDELATRYGAMNEAGEVAIELNISQSELAQWCGLSREAVVKALRKLRTVNWITTTDGRVTILDRPAVRSRGEM